MKQHDEIQAFLDAIKPPPAPEGTVRLSQPEVVIGSDPLEKLAERTGMPLQELLQRLPDNVDMWAIVDGEEGAFLANAIILQEPGA